MNNRTQCVIEKGNYINVDSRLIICFEQYVYLVNIYVI